MHRTTAEAAAGGQLDDVLAARLSVVFVGINPSPISSAAGHNFATPGNRFWPALHASGFTPTRMRPDRERDLLTLGLGITSIVRRSTGRAAELTAHELVDGGRDLAERLRVLSPQWVAMLGVTGYRTAFDARRAEVGPQSATLADARVWILPNPSGRNAHYPPTAHAAEFTRLRHAAGLPDLAAPGAERRPRTPHAARRTERNPGRDQGESLGLRWQFVDRKAGTLKTWWQLQRLTWRHGCTDPHACGTRLHKGPCPPDCTRHTAYQRGCPRPCTPDCTMHASSCPERKGGGLVLTRPKTRKSQRVVPIPPPLVPVFEDAWQRQQQERAAAGEAWQDDDLVFCRSDGRPIDPRDDWEEFKELLKEAGIDDRRVHDGRHSAGTILNELGVDIRTIMEILGHTQLSMTRRYVHATTPLTEEAARRMGDALWPQPKTETSPTREARARRHRRLR